MGRVHGRWGTRRTSRFEEGRCKLGRIEGKKVKLEPDYAFHRKASLFVATLVLTHQISSFNVNTLSLTKRLETWTSRPLKIPKDIIIRGRWTIPRSYNFVLAIGILPTFKCF